MSTFLTDQSSITAFNRGPVTPVFTPPASCLSTLTTFSDLAYYGHIDSAYYNPACYPTSTLDGGANAWSLYYYSPAQCPLGWAHAATVTGSFTGRGSTTLSVGSDTTVVVCCPSGFIVATADHACYSSFASELSTIFYISPVINDNTWYSTDANSPSTTVIGPTAAYYYVFGDGIPVWYQSSDLAAFSAPPETSSTTASSSSNPITTTSTPTTSSSTPTNFSPRPTNSPTTTSNGMSSGAKIGIGVGIPLALIAIGLVAFFIYFRRRGSYRMAGFEDKSQLEDTSRPKPLVHELATPDLPEAQDMNSDNARYNSHFSVDEHQLPFQGGLVHPDDNLPSMDRDGSPT